MATDQPTAPPEVALGDEMLRKAHNSRDTLDIEMASVSTAIAQAHYQRQIALVLTDLLDLFSHEHEQHGVHAEQAQEHPHLEEPHA